jgi:hypothetical protein
MSCVVLIAGLGLCFWQWTSLHGGERHGQRAVWLQRVSPHMVQLIACGCVNLLGFRVQFKERSGAPVVWG